MSQILNYLSASLLAAFAGLWLAAASFGQTDRSSDPHQVLISVLNSSEYREFIEDQFENAEDLFAGHRDCEERALVSRIGTDIRVSPEIDQETSQLTAVDLFDSWQTERCGKTIQHNFTLWVVESLSLVEMFGSEEEAISIAMADLAADFAHPDSITLIDFTIPGTTLVTDEMVADIVLQVTDDAEVTHFDACQDELVVVNTEFAEEVEKIRRAKKSKDIRRGKWGEFWTVYGCGKEVRYPVIVTKTPDTYEIEVFAKDAHLREFRVSQTDSN
jgi:hypothetical protein